MLMLGGRSITVEGITVFPDHADQDQFWYLPGPVQLARDQQDQASFTFIKYKPAAVSAGAKGGGFLTFAVELALPEDLERRLLSQLRRLSRRPRLTVAPFDEGTVQVVALDLQGSGGTNANVQEGSFQAVEKILGAAVPSLAGDNTAAFSLSLSQEGATILEQAFEQGTSPVGVIYDLKYTGMRPALRVEIKADLERVYNQFSASLEAQIYFVKGGIDAAFEKLVQDGAIEIKVLDFVGDEDQSTKEQWALDFFKNDLLSQWFQPTLSPGQIAGGQPQAEGLDAVLSRARALNPVTAPATPPTPATTPATPPPAPATVPPRQGPLPAAAYRTESTTPDPAPPGYQVVHVPAPEGTTETLTITGGSTAPTVTVDGQARELDASRQIQIEVPESGNVAIQVQYPASAQREETFELFYDFDKPTAAGFSASPPSPKYQSYLANSPAPPDARFSGSQAPPNPGITPGLEGADALRDWVSNRLADPPTVRIEAHASFENDRTAAKRAYNLALSGRRRDVAAGIIQNQATVSGGEPHGQTDAESAGRVGQPAAGPLADPGTVDRVARITGNIPGDEPGVTINGRLTRGRRGDPPPPPPPGRPTVPPVTPPATTPATSSIPAVVSFRLRAIHQEERKRVTVIYDRSEATQRTYAPQGFFGLLAGDLDRDRHFVEVDLDDPFFRAMDIQAEAPFDFASIGLQSIHLALDYGAEGDPAGIKHGDFVFDATQPGPHGFSTTLNPGLDLAFRHTVQYHFDPDTDWLAKRFSYNIAAQVSEDRTLLLNPHAHLGFLKVTVLPHRMDAGMLDATDVHLWTDEMQEQDATVLRVEPTSAPAIWRARLEKPGSAPFHYRLVHHLKNGESRISEPVKTKATTLPVDDPFPTVLEIDFMPVWDPTTTRNVFLEIAYDDQDNNIERRERLTRQGADISPLPFRLAIADSSQRLFRFRVTQIMNDNTMRQGDWIETADTLVALQDQIPKPGGTS